jgi:hypothetical protein
MQGNAKKQKTGYGTYIDSDIYSGNLINLTSSEEEEQHFSIFIIIFIIFCPAAAAARPAVDYYKTFKLFL